MTPCGWIVSYGRLGGVEGGVAYLCGALDVLQVAGDEAGLLLVGVRHCDFCCGWVVVLLVKNCFVLVLQKCM